jgi:putative SOS response-associated peptidase YedK
MTRWKRRAAPSWNVAPTQDVPIITEKLGEGAPERHLLIARWGLMPSWAKDVKIGSKLINARSETILEKPSFRKRLVCSRIVCPTQGQNVLVPGVSFPCRASPLMPRRGRRTAARTCRFARRP